MWLFVEALFITAPKWKHSHVNHGDGWMDKQSGLYLYNGILLSNERQQATDTGNSTDKAQKHYTKGMKPDTKDHRLYDSIYMTSLKRHYSRSWRQSSGGLQPGMGGGRVMEVFYILSVLVIILPFAFARADHTAHLNRWIYCRWLHLNNCDLFYTHIHTCTSW